jgi:hypothetical protein
MKTYWTLLFLLIVNASIVAGCAYEVSVREIAREDPDSGGQYIRIGQGEGVVKVFRGGRLLEPQRGMALQLGDEIETASNGAAIIYFEKRGEVVLVGATRVRISSIEVLFGRVFAKVRGIFTISSENVIAGAAGTSFMFELEQPHSVRVAVAEGTVICRPRVGSDWAPLRLDAGQALAARFPLGKPLYVEPAHPAVLEEIHRWSQLVSNAPELGYCCESGRVFKALSTQCRGEFRWTQQDAHTACSPIIPGR